MDVHPTKNGIFIGIDPYPYEIHHVKPRLASPFPVTVVLWGGYAWRSIDDGPPGCEGRPISMGE